MAHVAAWKKKEVDELATTLANAPVVGVIEYSGIPSPQMQNMRKGLRGHADIKAGKKNLFHLALEKAGGERSGLQELTNNLDGQVALIATDMNPFKLYKKMAATRQKMPAKAGDIAPEDIAVKKGDTPFKPGPVVGELQKAGIPAAIDQGKVVIKSDKVLVREGETISADLAAALSKLEIHPIEVGLNLQAVWENGLIFKPEVLAIDETQFLGEFQGAIQNAFNLAVNASYFTPLTTAPIISKAHREAIALVLEAGFLEKGTEDLVIGKANAQALALARQLQAEALDEEIQAKLSAAPAAAAAPAGEKKEEKKEKEEEKVSEEDAASGLGALFG